MKVDSIEEVSLPLCNTLKNIRGASRWKYECLINRDVNMNRA